MKYSWYLIDAYRGAHYETPQSCASRFERMLNGLGSVHPDLAKWFAGANKSGAGSVPADQLSAGSLAKRFSEGMVRRDSDDSPILELGYRIHAWNGIDTDRRSFIEITAGALASG